MNRQKTLAYAAFAAVCVIWGTTYLGIRIAVRSIPPLLMTGARFTVAGLILLALARLRGELFPRRRGVLAELALVGVLMVGMGNLAVAFAEQWIPSGIAALLVATAPFWAVVLERIRESGERIDRRQGAGILIGFLGVGLLVTPGAAGGAYDVHFVIGALLVQVGCFAWQYGTSRGKHNLANVPPLMSSALQMLAGGIVVEIVGIAIGEPRRLAVTREGLMALAYLTLFGSVLAYTSYVYALKNMRVTSMSVYAYINPAVAVLLGWLILNEQMTWVSITAMAVILGGVALVQTPRRTIATLTGYARIPTLDRSSSRSGGSDDVAQAAGADPGRR